MGCSGISDAENLSALGMKGADEDRGGSMPTLPDGKIQNSSSKGVYCR